MGYVDSIKSVDTVPYLICKTHDELTQLDTDVKFIFVYGDPFDSALSVNSMVQRLGIDWFSEHQQHLRASGEFCDLYKKDVLNYEGQINSWMAVRRTNIFCVDYDDLWSMIDELERFCEFPIELPERRIRESTSRPELVQSELFEKLRHIKNSAKQKYHDSHANEYFG